MFTYIRERTIGLGIEASLLALKESGIVQERENQDKYDITKEIQLCLDIEEPFSEPFISRCIVTDLKGLAQYDKEFLDGISDNLGWKYTYHQLYSKYYNQLIDELYRNLNTRRACIALGQGDINFSNDPPCLQLIMITVVNNKVEMTVIFRSNDGVKAFPMNIHACAMLQHRIADELTLEVGPLHYIANNFHAYSKDFDTLNNYCKIFENANYNRRFSSYEDLLKVY